jgi:hypothetical protein
MESNQAGNAVWNNADLRNLILRQRCRSMVEDLKQERREAEEHFLKVEEVARKRLKFKFQVQKIRRLFDEYEQWDWSDRMLVDGIARIVK